MNLKELSLDRSICWNKSVSLVGGSASPFIDEGDGFTGERERVQMFLSLVAYADKNWIMVDAPNTVDVAVGCQMCTEGRDIFFRKDGRRYLQTLLDAWWHVRSHAMFTRYGRSWSPYRNRCPETRGGGLPYGSFYRPL